MSASLLGESPLASHHVATSLPAEWSHCISQRPVFLKSRAFKTYEVADGLEETLPHCQIRVRRGVTDLSQFFMLQLESSHKEGRQFLTWRAVPAPSSPLQS